MNRLETLLDQAKAETKKMCQESYSEGFADAEGALHIMQRMFNDVQNILLKALGRERRPLEDTITTANEVSEKLKPKVHYWAWDWSNTPPLRFGGSTNTPKSLVFSEAENTPCTAELEVGLKKLVAYFERRAKENTKRAEKLEKRSDSFQQLGDYLQNERSSYYFSGKADSYTRAAEKVRELLG